MQVRRETILRRLRRWLDERVLKPFDKQILPIDAVIARRCAALHVPDPRPERDALIAATALRHGLTVVTRNVGNFESMGVGLLNPWATLPRQRLLLNESLGIIFSLRRSSTNSRLRRFVNANEAAVGDRQLQVRDAGLEIVLETGERAAQARQDVALATSPRFDGDGSATPRNAAS